jgi:hypothetical protein
MGLGAKTRQKEKPMNPLELVRPWRLIVGIPPLLYGGLLLLGLPESSTWLLLVAGVLLLVVTVASRLEYPLLPLWPALVGLFLLSTCVFALIEDVVDYAIVPFTDTDIEIIVVALIACGYIAWGITMTRKMLAF